MTQINAWPGFHKMPNPYARALYERITRRGIRVDDFDPRRFLVTHAQLWHIHGPDYLVNTKGVLRSALRVFGFSLLLCYARLRRICILWTINNVQSHERYHPLLEKTLWRVFVTCLDGYIAYSRAGQRRALERFPALAKKPAWLIPHGHYRGLYPVVVSRDAARARLGVPAHVRAYLFFGSVRAYKNVPGLINAFVRRSARDAWLIVAGHPSPPELGRQIESLAAQDSRIRLMLDLVPDDEVQYYFQAADIVVLPFSDILNSGSAMLALSFDRPVVVPRLGAMEELRASIGPDWVWTYDGALTAETLDLALEWACGNERAQVAPLSGLDWGTIAESTVAAYEGLVGMKARPANSSAQR
ncbi:MAG: glycosyltransferase [Steroidobacteraceae bacterium]|nr:glycosyltransferase [Steroidobacteraceae bacterium]